MKRNIRKNSCKILEGLSWLVGWINHETVIVVLKKLAREDRSNSEIALRLAEHYQAFGAEMNYFCCKDAQKWFKRAIHLDPMSAYGYWSYGDFCMTMKENHELAFRYFKKSLALLQSKKFSDKLTKKEYKELLQDVLDGIAEFQMKKYACKAKNKEASK
jgi:tetratricopeptide (TPR) repeat protein